jgi:hypothetical protein
MTSELEPGYYIEKFVSGGSKNYAYVIVDPMRGDRRTVCKVRGITLNYTASQLVNFDVIKNMILNEEETDIVTVHTDRKRAGGRIHIFTETRSRMYRILFLREGT